MEIDWKAAPEWADGAGFLGIRHYFVWINDSQYQYGHNGRIYENLSDESMHSRVKCLVMRPDFLMRSGQVLPPINTECEAKNPTTGNWNRIKVLDHDDSNQCAVCREIGTDKLWWSDSFRAVRTAEEIAEETREREILEIARASGVRARDGHIEIATRLHDAGCRMVTP